MRSRSDKNMGAAPACPSPLPGRQLLQLGLIVDIRVHYFREVAEAIIAHAHHLPDVRIRIMEPSVAAMLAYADLPHMDGIIAHPLPDSDYAALHAMGIAIVNFSSRLKRAEAPPFVGHVVANDQVIGELAAGHLRRMGLRHFGFYGSDSLGYCNDRLAGFTRYMEQLPWRVPPALDLRMQSSKDAAEWIRELKLPVGIFAANDNYAKTLIVAATRAGLRVPEDVAVVGVDADTIQSQLSPVTIASVQPDAKRLADRALRALIAIIRQQRHPAEVFEQIPPLGIRYAGSAPLNHAADPTVAKALKWLEHHLSEAVQIDSLAKAVGLSRRALEYRFRTQLDCAPYEKLLEMRLRKARELILRTNHTFQSIALDTGFTNQREFCVRFKQKEGCTPTQFRNAKHSALR